jgi:hypothetical protein
MNPWVVEVRHILDTVRGYTHDNVELGLMAFVGLVIFLVSMKLTGKAVRNENAEVASNCVVLLIGTCLLLAAVVAVRLYLLPRVPSEDVARWLVPATLVVMFFLVLTPLLSMVQGTGYLAALLMLVVSLTLASIGMALTQGAYRAVEKGEVTFGKARERKETMDEFMGK